MRRTALLALAVIVAGLAPRATAGLFGSSAKPQVGDDAPRFVAPLLEGGDFDLGPHIGQKAIVLSFWSIYCVSCVQEMPRLVDLHERYSDDGLMVVGVDLDSFGTRRVVKFVKGLDFTVPYPLVVDKRREVATRFGVSVLPTTILIDRQGKVNYYHVGYSPGDETHIEEKIVEALNAGS